MKVLDVLHLYPNEMNTYGDHGNAQVLVARIAKHGYQPVIHHHHPGSPLPAKVDLIIGGGGQDSAQSDIQTDIARIADDLHKLADDQTPMLLVCGTYQLFGTRFITQTGQEVKGIGILNVQTIGGDKRLVGNVMAESDFGLLFGFENHSGQTQLGSGQATFGKIVRGKGNNGVDKTEGARTNNVFGTYLHGPLLPNNPVFCDALVEMAAKKRYQTFVPRSIDDRLAQLARANARRRRY